MSSIPGHGLRVREKILAMPSMGVGGETHVRRNKCVEWASVKKKSFMISVSSYKASEGIVCSIDPRDTTHEIKQRRSFIVSISKKEQQR